MKISENVGEEGDKLESFCITSEDIKAEFSIFLKMLRYIELLYGLAILFLDVYPEVFCPCVFGHTCICVCVCI